MIVVKILNQLFNKLENEMMYPKVLDFFPDLSSPNESYDVCGPYTEKTKNRHSSWLSKSRYVAIKFLAFNYLE